MNEIHLNHSLSPYGGNNFHHLHPYPAKPSGQSRHHPTPHHSSHSALSSHINLTQNMRYFNEDSDLYANDTEADNTPLNRHHRNATSSPNSPNSAMITSSAGAAAAVMLPATSTLPTLLWSNRSRIVDWNKLQQSLNGTVGLIDSTTPLQPPPLTLDFDTGVYDGSDSDAVVHLWPSSQEIPILIGAIVGGGVLLIVLIILLVIWNCCDRHGCCNGSHDKNNFNNGSSDRSNRSSLSVASCGSGSAAGGNGAKRNSSSLYINNPNSLEVEAGCGSPDALGTSTTATIHPQHYHFTNYDYGPGPGGGVAQLVIGNTRVLATAVTTTQSDNAIPRSVSVPLSRSNSRKDSGSANLQSQHGQLTAYVPCGEPLARSQLSQALTRNIATYYETQRKKNAKTKGGVASGGVPGGASADKSAIILNDLSLSLNMDMAHIEGQPYGNVIVNRPSGPWVMLQCEDGNVQPGELDLEANHGAQSEFYRTRSLPWSQSSRGSGKFAGTSVSGTSEAPPPPPPQPNSTMHSGGTTTMGRVNFTKNRRNRMRNDSAAAIAFNRSGFLSGSLDWDFNGVGRGPDELDHIAAVVIPPPNKPVKLSSMSAHSTSANTPVPDRSTIAGSSSASKAPITADSGSPDSAEYIPNDSFVVYNERTAL